MKKNQRNFMITLIVILLIVALYLFMKPEEQEIKTFAYKIPTVSFAKRPSMFTRHPANGYPLSVGRVY